MSDQPRKKPGKGYPVVPLPEAARIVREAGKYGFEHSVSAFARYMGHNSTNSGAFRQRLAAFRDWKLIAGRGDTVVLTETAQTIALPPDADAERVALQTAFMNCGVFSELYERVTKGQTVEAQLLGAKAVHELGIAPTAVDRFTASFIDSAMAASLARRNDNGQLILLEVATGDEPAEDSTEAKNGFQASASQQVASPTRIAPVIHQEWPLEAGSIVLEVRLAGPLPAAAFAQVGTVVKQIESLAEHLRQVAADGDL